MMDGFGGHGDWWVLMSIGMIVFAGLIVWAIYALSRSSARPRRPENSREDARTILDQRLARGEIADQEYTKLRGLITPADGDSEGSVQARG